MVGIYNGAGRLIEVIEHDYSTGEKEIVAEKYIAVQIKTDESSHYYIVPNDEAEEFSSAMETGYLTDDYSEAEKFEKYRTGGDVNNYQLFISESEMKKLTGE